MTRGFLIGLLCLAVAAVGCGGGDGSAGTVGGESTTTSDVQGSVPAPTPVTKIGGEKNFRPQPKVKVPNGPSPKQLQVKDLIEGSGAEVAGEAGEKVMVHYVLVDYETGKQLATNWRRNEPGTYTLGTHTAIEGWNKGLTGMKVGGRRELIIPPQLAFGAEGAPPVPPTRP